MQRLNKFFLACLLLCPATLLADPPTQNLKVTGFMKTGLSTITDQSSAQSYFGAGGGAGSVNTGKILWVDQINGNNSTAVRGKLTLSFATIGAAKSNALSGDLVYVMPGTYTDRGWLTNGVNYYFSPGASNIVTDLTTNTPLGIINDYAGATTNVISGEGFFQYNTTWNPQSFSAFAPKFGAVILQNSNSVFKMSGHTVSTGTNAPYPSGGIIISNCSYAEFNVPNIVNGIYWERGHEIRLHNVAFNGNTNPAGTGYYAVYSHIPPDMTNEVSNFYYDGDLIASTGVNGANAFFAVAEAANLNYRSWINVKDIQSSGGIGRIAGKSYLNFGTAHAGLGSGAFTAFSTPPGSKMEIVGDRLVSSGSFFGIGGEGDTIASILDYEDGGIVSAIDDSSGNGDGSLDLRGGTMTVTNGYIIQVLSDPFATANVIFHNMTFSNLADNPAFDIQFDGLTFDNCSIWSSTNFPSITTSTTSSQIVKTINSTVWRTDPDTNIFFTGSPIQIFEGTNTPLSKITAPYNSTYHGPGTNFFVKLANAGTNGWSGR